MFEGPQSYAPILPEITLSVGAMVLLMFGAFRTATDHLGRDVCWLAIALLALAGTFLVLQPASSSFLFQDAFISDRFSQFMKLLVLFGTAIALLLSLDYFARLRMMWFEIPVLMLLSVVGMMVMISANDLITLYVGLELQSLALYVLAAVRRNDLRSSEAGLKYFVLGALSSGMLLYGMSLIYGFSGTTEFHKIAAAASGGGAGANIGLIVGLVFLLVGLAFKISAVPFHMWTPDVYEGAPTPITAFFAAAPKVAAMAVLVRVLISAFPGNISDWQQIIVFLSIMSMGIGAFAAIGQTNIKRLMAYSSIGHIGFALVGLASGSNAGIEAVLIYMAIYMVMTLGAFACILAMRSKDGMIESIDQLAGLSETNLSMAFIFAMLLFSMAGIPPLAGFFAKFYVFAAAVKAGLYPLAVIGVVASVIAAFYYLRLIKVMFFDPAGEPFQPADTFVRFVMWASCILVLAYVVLPSPLINAASAAVRSLRFAP
ncbi:MAG: NADH-quinone oxidoreductase subunit NuoN [Alphaproteobacteria bacterium]|nr:NADH-quinone oxidoreductase subunit NuoN [Alphaproteobacteria bacterium]